nr:signal peptidase I [uncultured Holophaga sp.]
MAKDKTAEALPKEVAKGSLRDNAELLCFGILLIMFFKTFVGQQFTIPSGSMRNTLMIGDHLLINKFIFARPQWSWEEKLFPMRSVQRGDIIVFRYPLDREQDYVKRCVALAGDTVEIRDKRLYINGRQATGPWEHHTLHAEDGPVAGPWPPTRGTGSNPDEVQGLPVSAVWPYLDPEIQAMDQQGREPLGYGYRDRLGPIKVPEGHIFAMGDNRENSLDGRYWGFLPVDHLRGRPFFIWWSYREGGRDDQNARIPNGPADVVSNIVDGARHFFSWTRWERTGTVPK